MALLGHFLHSYRESFTGVSKEIEKLGRVERVLMNFTPRGIAMKSTSDRIQLIQGAFNVFKKYRKPVFCRPRGREYFDTNH